MVSVAGVVKVKFYRNSKEPSDWSGTVSSLIVFMPFLLVQISNKSFCVRHPDVLTHSSFTSLPAHKSSFTRGKLLTFLKNVFQRSKTAPKKAKL